MIRILFDEAGDAHSDLMLKIDGLVAHSIIGDSYYLLNMYRGNTGSKNNSILDYLDRFAEIVSSVDHRSVFLEFDLCDECVGGILLKASKNGLIHVKYVTTQEVAGHSYNLEKDAKAIAQGDLDLKIEGEWHLSKQGILDGIEWSKDRIILLKK